MGGERIVTGQVVERDKLQRARELRRQMTPEEQVLWQHLRANRLAGLHFRRQQVIDGFIVDFYCHAAGVVVELDGGIHRAQVEADTERDAVLAGRGLRVLRFRNEAVRENLGTVLEEIAAACQAGVGGM